MPLLNMLGQEAPHIDSLNAEPLRELLALHLEAACDLMHIALLGSPSLHSWAESSLHE